MHDYHQRAEQAIDRLFEANLPAAVTARCLSSLAEHCEKLRAALEPELDNSIPRHEVRDEESPS